MVNSIGVPSSVIVSSKLRLNSSSIKNNILCFVVKNFRDYFLIPSSDNYFDVNQIGYVLVDSAPGHLIRPSDPIQPQSHPTSECVGIRRFPPSNRSDPTTFMSVSFQSDSGSERIGNGTHRFRQEPAKGSHRTQSDTIISIYPAKRRNHIILSENTPNYYTESQQSPITFRLYQNFNLKSCKAPDENYISPHVSPKIVKHIR